MLGAGRGDEDGGMDGAAWGSPRAGPDVVRAESSAMISLLFLLYKWKEKNEVRFSRCHGYYSLYLKSTYKAAVCVNKGLKLKM